MKKYFKLSVLSLSFALCWFSGVVYADIAVIVHPSNKSKINAKDVKRIFLDQRKVFPSGGKVLPVDQPEEALIRKVFSKKVIKKSRRELKSYWSRVLFTGQGSPPPIKKDDSSVKEFVAASQGGIGYIDVKNVDRTVKVVFTFR